MARPKSKDKKLALLEAATTAFAQSGVVASTAVMTRNAGVAEGTLFRCFTTKDDLINELYLFLKQDLCQSVIANLDCSVTDARTTTHYIWNSYIDWDLSHTYGHRMTRQLAVSGKIGKETEQQADGMFPGLHNLRRRSIRPEFMSDEYRAFGNALFLSPTETTMEFTARGTARANDYISMRFEAMQRVLTREEQ